jgi:DNA-binding NtrC family response regulator
MVLATTAATALILGSSAVMARTVALARLYAMLPRPLVLVGPTGVGKGLLARFIHTESRRPGPFVVLSGGELAETLYPDELRGHEAGAFTGASRSFPGAFERAHAGTMFADELPLWPLGAQAAILRMVDEGVVTRLGGEREVSVTGRVIFAANRHPDALVDAGLLLPDLRYRMREFVIEVPPLAGRGADIAELAYHFLDRVRAEFRYLGPTMFDPAALDRLVRYTWPGNVRELGAVVEWGVVQAAASESERVALPHLPSRLTQGEQYSTSLGIDTRRALSRWAFERAGHDRRQAALLLGVHPNTIDHHCRPVRG